MRPMLPLPRCPEQQAPALSRSPVVALSNGQAKAFRPHAAAARRAEISDRRRAGLRRRAGRMAARFGVLFLSDVLALYTIRATLRWVVLTQWPAVEVPGDFRSAGPLSSPGEPASLVFWIAAPMALALTSSYSRYRQLNTPIRLAMACLIAGISATIPLAAVVGARVALAQATVVAAATWLALIAARILAEKFLRYIWPREMGAAPTVLVDLSTNGYSRTAAAVSAPGGDFLVVARHEVQDATVPDPRALSLAIAELIDLHHAEAVVVAVQLSERHLGALVPIALDAGCIILVTPQAVEVGGVSPRLAWHGDQPFLEFATPGLHVAALLTKRITDVIIGVLLLTLAAPVMVLIALGIVLDSPGPPFFSQSRAGLGGRRFRMIKFRTMRISAEAEKKDLAHLNHTGDTRLFKIPEDPRVTRFGRFLRRWSLDELPQLWNVLRSDMSLVGPRPFFESDFEAYEEHHFRRLDTKPGITGLWQVSGRSEVIKFEDVVFLDRQYIEQWSFWLDVDILLRTIPSVMRRRGAY